MLQTTSGRFASLRIRATVAAVGRALGVIATVGWLAAAGLAAPVPAGTPTTARYDRLPRKVVVGTVVSGYGIDALPLAGRLERMNEIVDAISARAKKRYPDHRLDLVVLPEYFLGRPGQSLSGKAVRLPQVQAAIAACAQRHACYLVVPMRLQEDLPAPRISNAAVLVDRAGRVAGIYRKVHPVGDHGSEILEEGTTPGREFPVFDCDFGRLGIQICFDMEYPDGWEALARRGAEIVALPSASPETIHPRSYAQKYEYYIVSATPRDHAAVFSPLGLVESEATREGGVLVDEIDLSFEILHWDAALEEGAALKRRFGDNVGYHYYRPEDMGIFWSNNPKMTIGQMVGTLGLSEADREFERLRKVQDRVRGGPPDWP